MINGKMLQNMKIIKQFSPSEKDLKESTAPTKLMTDVVEVPLQARRKRTATDAGSEASGAQTKKSRKDKSEASNPDNTSASIPKRKRGKGESSIIKDAASEADAMDWDAEAEEGSAKKKQSSDTQYESPMFVMTPAMARMTKEYVDTMIAEKKQKKVDYLAFRDAKL